MSLLPVDIDKWTGRRNSTAATPVSEISKHVPIAAIVLRTIFLGLLMIMILRVNMPESSTIWTAYQEPRDLIRLALGVAACAWIGVQLFAMPKDLHAHRTWIYLGLAAVPFALICVVGLW